MLAYRFFLQNNDSFDIVLDGNGKCSFSINGKIQYDLRQEGDLLYVKWEVKLTEEFQQLPFSPVVTNSCSFQYRMDSLEKVELQHELLAGPGRNCCNMNGEEYCVFEGCVRAPCGTICA